MQITELIKQAANDLDPKEWAIYDKVTGIVLSPLTYSSKDEALKDLEVFFDPRRSEVKPFDRKNKS